MARIRSDRLLRLRLDRGWTQEQAAEKIGVDARTYRRYERQEIGITNRAGQFDILRAIAAAFDLNGPEDLLAEGSPPTLSSNGDIGPAAVHPGSGGKMFPAPSERAPQPPDSQYDLAWYVHRDEEELAALNKLRTASAPVVLQGPYLQGKGHLASFLIEEIGRRVEEEDAPVVFIRLNFGSVERTHLQSLDSLLYVIAKLAIEQAAPQRAQSILDEVWQRPGSANSKLARLLQRDVLAHHRTLLVLEKVERLHGCSFQDDFFALLRGWVEQSFEDPWSRLRILVTVATEPTLLDSLDHSSFFALANPIRLSGFDRPQTERLAFLYNLVLSSAVADQLATTLRGHPYLLRVVFYESVMREVSVESVLARGHTTSVFGHHLKSLHRWAEENQLLGVIGSIISNPGGWLSFRDYCKLYSHGLIIEEEIGIHRIRCPLYEEYFKTICRNR